MAAFTVPKLAVFAEYTRGQMLDGIGDAFTQSGIYLQNMTVEFGAVHRSEVTAVNLKPARTKWRWPASSPRRTRLGSPSAKVR